MLIIFRLSHWCHTFNYLNVKNTTLSNGYLGSRNDEERSEMRYVMRIAEFSESSNLWTQIALLGSPRSTPLSVSVQHSLSSVCIDLVQCMRVGWIMRVCMLARSVSWNTWSESSYYRSALNAFELDSQSLTVVRLVTWILAFVVFLLRVSFELTLKSRFWVNVWYRSVVYVRKPYD